jgi:hypothetical protein
MSGENEAMQSIYSSIKLWSKLDNQIRQLNEEKTTIASNLNEYIDDNNIDRKNINVIIDNSQIKFATTKVPQSLSFTFLKKCLSEIIDDENQVEQIIDYIKNKREITETCTIKKILK